MEDVVTSLQKKYGYELEIVRGNTISFFRRLFMPAFPAVKIDGKLVSKDRVITEWELEAEILKLRQRG